MLHSAACLRTPYRSSGVNSFFNPSEEAVSYLCTMIAVKPNIRHMSLEQLTDYFLGQGEKKFRIKQVYEWIWKKNAQSFDDMTDLSKELRQKLSDNFELNALKVNTTQFSSDGTVKSRFMTHDGHMIEG